MRSVGRLIFALSIAALAFGIVCALTDLSVRASATPKAQPITAALSSNPDAVCAGCHQNIYEKYERTPMAKGSGTAFSGLLEGGFLHAASGVRYSVFLRDGKAWMSYARDREPVLHGERQLMYFVGSGRRGRTYLYQVEGQWFEVPINYYGKKQLWDMAPNYGATKTMPEALPVDSNCLHCHATAVQMALPEARNKYEAAPFQQGGVGCTACHGDSSLHLAEKGHGPIVNPAKLPPARRDSTCLQCHLEGDVAIYRAGTSLAQFHAGADLADYAVYFVKASAASGGGRASSQNEALLRSACKVASGDKLTCTTCHDPHSSPSAEERVSYFRGRCLTCHTSTKMATMHHPEERDCAVCHMPTRTTTDISHEQATDHNIQRRPASTAAMRFTDLAESTELVPVGSVSVGDRELGLAYAQLAEHGDRVTATKAIHLLAKAEKAGHDDAQLHTQLGFMQQMSGDKGGARKEYADALKEDPYQATVLGNLAVLDASSGGVEEAIALLQRAVDADPSQMAPGLNLAFIECRLGDKKKALEILMELSRFNPDDPTLRKFLISGSYAGQRCELR
ncbi:tetratricopeptide repeat protein [Tunturiibacter lichenicola]|uniref:tetratricopeptide repeat protein n=1 Tax=Tunturiibacter lichenicola TaxID=2051959 RepID=UPI003D9B629A